MTNDLNTIQKLRPQPGPLDAAWSAHVLSEIYSQPTTKHRRATRVAVGTAAIVFATAGAAYATGLVPQFISRGFGDVSTGAVTDQRLVADVTLPDERRVGVWTGVDAHGNRCRAIADDWDGSNRSAASSFECGPDTPIVDYLWTSAGYRMGTTPPPAYLIVFGESPQQSVTSVHVTGRNIDLTIPVEGPSGGFGAYVPVPPRAHNASGTPVMEVEFLDARGSVVSSDTLRDS